MATLAVTPQSKRWLGLRFSAPFTRRDGAPATRSSLDRFARYGLRRRCVGRRRELADFTFLGRSGPLYKDLGQKNAKVGHLNAHCFGQALVVDKAMAQIVS